MSTNNFSYKNVCVVLEDVEGDYNGDFWDYNVMNIQYELEQKIKGFVTFSIHKDRRFTKDKEALIIGEVDFYKSNGEWYGSLYATIKSGYYSDSCLDWDFEYENDDYEQNKNLTIEKKIQSRARQIVKIFKKFGTEVKKVAQFSNGEALYQKA